MVASEIMNVDRLARKAHRPAIVIPTARMVSWEKALQSVARMCYTGPMETTISQRELRNDSGAIMRRVEQGECFTVTRNGVPVADLVPHDRTAADRRRRFVPIAEVAAGVSRLPNWDVERFAAEQRQLDAAVDDSDAERWSTPR
jgi:prevent-host-death family protein